MDILSFLEVRRNPIVSMILTVLIFASYSSQALAASGGIMGGDSFSSSDSSSFSDYSSSGSYNASTSYGTRSHEDQELTPFLIVAIFFCFAIFFIFIKASKQKLNIIKLQVSLLGMDRSFQKDLNRIAERADTSTRKGYRNILTESAMSLIRHSHYWTSSHLYVNTEESLQNGEKLFSKLSFEERRKFDQETLVNLKNNVKRQEIKKQYSEDMESGNEYLVVTFLVATLGILKLPSINNPSDLKTVLVALTGISEKEIKAVQVLWTPQEENDTLSSQRVFLDYPLLKPL